MIPLGRVPSDGVTESQSSLLNGLQSNESEGEFESNLVLQLTRSKELSNGLLVSQIDIVQTVDKKNTWLDTVSTDELKEKQSQDPEIQWIIAWLKTGTSPSSNELYLANKGTKNNWINKSSFKLDIEGLLYKLGPGDKNLLVVPWHFQELALYLCHDIPSSAHQGIECTKVRVKDKYYWYSISKDVRFYVVSCKDCNKNKKPSRHAKAPMTLHHAGYPMERVHIDFLGPLPKTKKSNEHILMMIDQFSKWCECIPLPSQDAEHTATAALNEFFNRFGCPLTIFSDQGRNFESKLFQSVCELLHIHETKTTSYRPDSNGQIERYNRTLMDAVRCFVDKQQNDWDVYLPQLASALRSSVCRSTGFTANRLMLGRELTGPWDVVFNAPVNNLSENVDEYVVRLEKAMVTSYEMARNCLMPNQKLMKKDYDVRLKTAKYEVGDVVYLYYTAQIKGKSRKLLPPWKGPGVIFKVLSPILFKVRFNNSESVVNHDRIKLCRDRSYPKWVVRYREKILQGKSIPGVDEYCICRGPYNRRFMICCVECDEWFHGSCVGISKQDAESMDKYCCPLCAV